MSDLKDNAAVREVMQKMAKELMKPRPNKKLLDKLNAEMDKALGTVLQEEDAERAEAWERSKG